MERRLAYDLTLMGVFLIMIILLAYVLFQIKTTGVECVGDPLVYGVNQLEKKYDSEFSCTCSLANPKYTPSTLTNKGLIPFSTGPLSILPIIPYTNESNG